MPDTIPAHYAEEQVSKIAKIMEAAGAASAPAPPPAAEAEALPAATSAAAETEPAAASADGTAKALLAIKSRAEDQVIQDLFGPMSLAFDLAYCEFKKKLTEKPLIPISFSFDVVERDEDYDFKIYASQDRVVAKPLPYDVVKAAARKAIPSGFHIMVYEPKPPVFAELELWSGTTEARVQYTVTISC